MSQALHQMWEHMLYLFPASNLCHTCSCLLHVRSNVHCWNSWDNVLAFFFCSHALISSSTIERKGTYALKCTQTKRKLLILSYYISGQHHIVVIDNNPSQQEHFGYKVELLNYGNNLNHNYDEDYLSQKVNLKWSAFVKRFSLTERTEKVPHCKGKAKWKHHFKHLLEVLIVSEYQFQL